MDFDTEVKLAIYRETAKLGRPPSPADLAGPLATSADRVREAYLRLARNRLLVLEADGATIRMAPPFSGVATEHRVLIDGVDYYANCAWDALGIPAALHRPGIVRSRCAQSGAPLLLPVDLTGPEASPWVFHCLVPAARWWQDIVFT